MPNPRPDFAQFAERMRRANESKQPYQNPMVYDCDVATAERHARLLETIARWAQPNTPLSLIGDAYARGIAESQLHIRSLLEQP